MFDFGRGTIYLSTELTDMRKSFDTLAALVQSRLGRDPTSGDAFVFIGKRKNRLKFLIWEDSGYWLCAKRLEQGTFAIPTSDGGALRLSAAQWRLLLEGIVVLTSRRLKRYERRLTPV
ncbi:MAG: IS66 family insertion sequence element accessory protein TnpB [Rhodanobacteraceae bacterium]